MGHEGFQSEVICIFCLPLFECPCGSTKVDTFNPIALTYHALVPVYHRPYIAGFLAPLHPVYAFEAARVAALLSFPIIWPCQKVTQGGPFISTSFSLGFSITWLVCKVTGQHSYYFFLEIRNCSDWCKRYIMCRIPQSRNLVYFNTMLRKKYSSQHQCLKLPMNIIITEQQRYICLEHQLEIEPALKKKRSRI